MKSGNSDEVGGFIGVSFVRHLPCYGMYSSANSAFLRLSSMACRFLL